MSHTSSGQNVFTQPDAWHNVRTHCLRNRIRLALVIVSKVPGEQIYYHPTQLAALMTAFARQGTKPEDWDTNVTRQHKVDNGDFSTKGYARASTSEPAVQLNHIQAPVTQGRLPIGMAAAHRALLHPIS